MQSDSQREICKPCATGKSGSHNFDPEYCEYGMMANLMVLSDEAAAQKLRIIKRLPLDQATLIISLARSRNTSPLEIMKNEGLAS